MVESRAVVTAIFTPAGTAPDNINHHTIEVCHNDAVVITIRNKKSLALLICVYFSGKAQRCCYGDVAFIIKVEWRLVQLLALPCFLYTSGEKSVHGLKTNLAGMATDDTSPRVNYNNRWPAIDFIARPNHMGRIIDNRVFNLIAQHGFPNVNCGPFGRKLSGVDSDDDQAIRILVFELFQLGQDVHAIRTTVCPEIENHELAAQIF